MRLLIVDDDAAFRALLRTTFEVVDVEVEDVGTAEAALEAIERGPPDAIVSTSACPGMSGSELCRRVKAGDETSGTSPSSSSPAPWTTRAPRGTAGADAFLRKPFSPLELLDVVERLTGGLDAVPPPARGEGRSRTSTSSCSTRATCATCSRSSAASASCSRTPTERRSRRSRARSSRRTPARARTRSASSATRSSSPARLSPDLVDDPSAEYGFLLHDVGKIGIPDRILQKPGPLNEGETRLMRTHTLLGEQMLGGVAFLQGEGLRIVRSHHERWDGDGYPDGIEATDIPLAARIFAVADALDAMTSDRPYRPALTWARGGPGDRRRGEGPVRPGVVKAFVEREERLREIRALVAA